MTDTEQYQKKIIELVSEDAQRVQALDAVFHLGLPQCYISAGFVRNVVWDHLHHKVCQTPMNDVDVIYFDPEEEPAEKCTEYEARLITVMPELNWQVRNQARMHERNGDKPYESVLDAMAYWPEKETAVAIRKCGEDQYECVSAFGFESLFNMQLTHNPRRALDIFQGRVYSKNWLTLWPNLVVVFEAITNTNRN